MATFYNQATLTYRNTVASSNTVTGELLEALRVAKYALSDTYGSGETLAYALSLTNTGKTPLSGLTLTDSLGAYPFGTPAETRYPLTYVEGSLRALLNGDAVTPPTVTSTEPLTVTNVNIPANANLVLLYRAIPSEYAPLAEGGTIENTVTVTGNGIPTPLTATATVTAESRPLLSISKSISPSTVTENDTLTYTFVIENLGNVPAGAEENVVLTDVFQPPLSGLTVTVNGTPLDAGDYTYDEASGTFTTRPGAITLPAATYAQDPVTGAYTLTPGVAVVTVSGTV